MTFEAKMRTTDEVTLPVIASTIYKNAGTLCVKKLNDSLAKEPISTQDAKKSATRMLPKTKKQISSQLSKTIASI